MNILQQEDAVKGLPDDALMQEAQAPSGQVPQFLVVSEIQRRADMRKRYQEQEVPQGTVAEQIVGQAQQGIAAMQPQAMPPQGMPPQGMPPQGISPQGIPPQMPPQGMPPQQMAPQQMFGGGIIRLQGGGQPERMMKAVDMLAAGATPAMLLQQGYSQAEIELASQTYKEKMSAPPPQSQGVAGQISAPQRIERTPNPSILSDPAISDFAREVPSMVQNYPNQLLRGGQELFTGESTADPLGDILRSAKENVADPFMSRVGPYAQYGIEDTMDTYEEDGFLPAVGKGIRNILGLSAATAHGLYDVYGGIASGGISSLASTPELEEVEVTAQRVPQPEEVFPELSEAIKQAQNNPNDATAGATGTAQKQGLTDVARQGQTADPSLDLSDLIADAKQMSQANALMQLGAGIAGGDLSKGLSAAGMAATKGTQDARKIAISQRLAEYNAGRQDLDRQERARQFDAQLEVMNKRVAAYERSGRASVDAATIRAIQDELESLRQVFGIGPDDSRVKALENRLDQLVGAPQRNDVSPSVIAGQSQRDQQAIVSQYVKG